MSAAAQRWTPARIRKVTPFPKPAGAIAKARAYGEGATHQVTAREVALLRYIAEHADFIDKPVPVSERGAMPGCWLLVPMPNRLLSLLFAFEAELADLEDGADDEPDDDGEPSLAAPERTNQTSVGGTIGGSDDRDNEEGAGYAYAPVTNTDPSEWQKV